MASPWEKEKNELLAAGFSNEEVFSEASRQRKEMMDAGFSGDEIDEHFGVKKPDMSRVKTYFEENLKARPQKNTTSAQESLPEGNPDLGKLKPPEQADEFLEALDAGWQMSVSGLVARGENPDVILPEDAPSYLKIASEVSTLAGDLPTMIAGAFAGGAFGSAAGPVGTVLGAGAGSNALPTALREILMDHYEKGEFQDFKDFWERSSSVFINTFKSGVVGAATAGVGGKVAQTVGKVAAPVAVKTASRLSSEVATMVTVGKALEGEVPTLNDFIHASAVVTGMHVAIGAPKATRSIKTKLQNIYAKTGVRPEQVVEHAKTEPTVMQDLLSDNIEMPKAYENLVEVVEKPETPPPPKPEAARSEATNKILEQIQEKPEKTKEPLSFDEFYRKYVDKLDPINRATEELTGKKTKELSAADDPYQLARMSSEYKAKTIHAIEKGTLDYNTLEVTGKPLKEIFSPFKDDIRSFEAYLVSKRALEVESQGKTSGFDLEAAEAVVKEGKSKYEAAAKDLVEFSNNNLKYLKDAGVLSDEALAAFVEAGKSYVPFSRIVEQEVGKSGKPKSLKAFKGSEAAIQSPLLSIVENTEAIFRLAERNRAVSKLVDLAESVDGQTVIEKVPTKVRPIEVKAEEITKALEKQGLEIDAEAFDIFRPQFKSLADNEFAVYRNGKREVYKTEPALAEAIKALEGDTPITNLLFKVANGITNVKKLGLTLVPEFQVKNLFRDQLTTGTFSKHGTLPFLDIVGAMGDLFKKNDAYYSWLKSGGSTGTFLEFNQKYLESDVFKLAKETAFLDSTWNILKKPVDIAMAAGTMIERSTRLAEFKRVTKGETSGKKVFEGGFSSREITIDFQRVGAKMSALNAITAFQNVSIQGLDRTVRALKDDPAGITKRAALFITAPSILLWWANKDDERYKEIPRWQKDFFWIVPTDEWVSATKEEAALLPNHLKRKGGETGIEINKGPIYRIPKPQELGLLFGSVPERLLEKFFTDNPRALKDFEETVTELLTPSFVPDILSAPLEHYMNKNTFTGAPIVPNHLEGILPEYQHTEYTTEAGKALGKMVAAVPGMKDKTLSSPMVIENYVRSWSGTTGLYALQLADKFLSATGVAPDKNKPEAPLADLPFVKAFVVRYPSASAQSIQDFYEKFRENQTAIATVKHLAKSGDFKAMQKETLLQEEEGKLQSLTGTKKALSNLSQYIRMVNKNPDIKPEEKRQIIDGVYFMMIEAAKQGVKTSDEVTKALKERERNKK